MLCRLFWYEVSFHIHKIICQMLCRKPTVRNVIYSTLRIRWLLPRKPTPRSVHEYLVNLCLSQAPDFHLWNHVFQDVCITMTTVFDLEDKSKIYIIIAKNICYILWNWGFWRSLNNTYPTFLTPCIRCTNHLCDSWGLIDVNPHFIPSLLPMIQNVDLLRRHRYKSLPPAIVTSQSQIVSAWLLWMLS